MMIENGDGTYTSGPLDVVLIYHNVRAGTFHTAYYAEAPFPGPVAPVGETPLVRLVSKMHHTTGHATLEEAQENARSEFLPVVGVRDYNVDLEHPMPWDGSIGDVIVMPNWRMTGAEMTFSDAVAAMAH